MERFNGFDVEDLRDATHRVGPAWRDFNDARVFFTGATGFLGQWLLALMLHANREMQLGLRIVAISRDPQRFAARCPDLVADSALAVERGDVRFFNFPKGRFSHVIHAATDTSADADSRPLQLLETIIDGTRRVLSFARVAGVRKLLFTSSGAIYGPQPPQLERIPEDYLGACPTTERGSVYGQSKRLAEQLLAIHHREFALETKVARCFAFVGPAMSVDGHFAIGNFIRDAVAGKAITVTGDGQPLRSYLYASDAAAWLLRMLAEGTPGGAWNVGSDEAVSIAQVAHRVATLLHARDVAVAKAPAESFRSRYVPDVRKARGELGVAAWTSLDQAIIRTAEWYRWSLQRPVHASKNLESGEPTTPAGSGRIVVVDIDGVVATLTQGNDYERSEAIPDNVRLVNRLFDKGYRIVLCTARGSTTGIDWTRTTERQLKTWGVKYHELRFGKPAGDFYVDDRMLTLTELAGLADKAD